MRLVLKIPMDDHPASGTCARGPGGAKQEWGEMSALCVQYDVLRTSRWESVAKRAT